MATVPKKADEELWYLRIVKNFVLPCDEDLAAQPSSGAGELTNLGIGLEKKKRAPTATTASRKNDAEKAHSSKVKNVRGEKKCMRHSSNSWCDYVVVSDSLEGLAPAIVKKPKAESRDSADIPPSNPEDPIDLESSPELLLMKKAGKRKQTDAEAEGQPAKMAQRKKIIRRGNLDAFISKLVPDKPSSPVHAEPSSAVNEDLPPSPSRALISEQLESSKAIGDDEAEKIAEVGIPEVENSVKTEKVTSPKATGVDAGHPKSPEIVAHDSEKGKSAQEIPVATSPSAAFGSAPVNVEKILVEDQGSFAYADKNSPIRPDETLGDYYYRTYSEKNASEIHAPVWNLKKGDTFSNWRVCRDWLQGTFPPREIKFQEGRLHEQTYHAYLEETATYTSTTYRILKATLEADRAKFDHDRKTEEWFVVGWKREAEAEASLLSKERKNWKEICEKDNKEKMGLRNTINNLKVKVERLEKQDAEIEILKQEKAEVEAARDEARSHRERSEQREVHTCTTLALRDKEIEELIALLSEQEQLKAEVESSKKDLELEQTKKAETSRRLTEIEDKLENSETARAKAENELEPLKSDMLWLKEHEIASTVAHLLVAAWNDGYAQGYAECSYHVVSSLKVDWDTSKSATHGVNTEAALAAAKTQFNTLQFPVMDLINAALHSEEFMTRLREIFPNREENEDEDLT
ncbi:hypothetical protein HanPI659440_Chr04g0157381 [Helianthus annuus]|nr:hypothetical protein HanPI659440_Chr04g0157381 [Helianthus annuus]